MTGKKVKGNNSEFDHYHFRDNGFSCKIVPSLGGSIQELIVNNTQIIEGVPINAAGSRIYSKLYNAALLFPFPNRIADGRYTHNDKSLQLELNDGHDLHAIHGLISHRLFEEVELQDNSLELEYHHSNSIGFPFPFNFKVKYVFTRDSLNIILNVLNLGNTDFPFGIGWHPYFRVSNAKDFSIRFQPDKQYILDEDLIPKDSERIGVQSIEFENAELDDAFRLTSGKIDVLSAQYGFTLTVADNSYLQIYTPEDRKSVAIEPMSCIGNAFNNQVGLRYLKPNEEFKWTIKMDFQS